MAIRDGRRVILLDLGGVLADLGAPARSMGLNISEDDFWTIWLNSESVREYETGELTTDEFCHAFAVDLGVGSCEFTADRFRSWKLQVFPEIDSLIRALTHSYRLALLSNTNELHWDQVTAESPCFSRFSEIFLSFDTGLYKPSHAAFRHAMRVLKCKPSEVLYFDDSEQNVTAASQIGIRTYHVKGVDQLEEALASALGL